VKKVVFRWWISLKKKSSNKDTKKSPQKIKETLNDGSLIKDCLSALNTKPGRISMGVVVSLVLIGAIIVIIVASCNWVDSNTVSLDFDQATGNIDKSRIYLPGRYYRLAHQFISFPTTILDVELENITVRSIEGIPIYISAILQYKINVSTINDQPENILKLYYNYELDYSQYIQYFMESSIYLVCSKHNTTDFWTQRTKIMNEADQEVKNSLSDFPIIINLFQIYDVTLTPDLEDEITNTSLAIFDSAIALSERELQINELFTRQSLVDQTILYGLYNMTTTINNLMTMAKSTQMVLGDVLRDEMTALHQVQVVLNMSVPEFEAYIYIKTMSDSSNTTELMVSIPSLLI